MIEGIDYYPKQRKTKHQSRPWIVLLLLAVAAIYWYLNQKLIETQSESTSIVVNDPAIELVIKPTPPTINPEQPEHHTPELLEQLDAFVPTSGIHTP